MLRTPQLKKIFHTSIALVLAVSLTGGYCRADEPITLPQGIDFSILPPPPADDSPTGLADLSVLLYVQSSRTPEQVAFAKKMESPSVFEMGREIFGPWFTRDNLPKTAAILSQMSKVTDKVKEDAKKNWMRPRPYTRSALVAPVVGKPGDAGCYPSGHTYGIAIAEFTLTAAFPEHSAQFDEMIHRVMWGRILGGVHYPSDTEAGRLLAKDVVEKMLKTTAMQEAVTTMRAEAAPFIAAEREKPNQAAIWPR
ncbi:phosphatase PAP2 family protein [bacterium]|nr:MAG: phosphatase PAP2 family protein [bacterium]